MGPLIFSLVKGHVRIVLQGWLIEEEFEVLFSNGMESGLGRGGGGAYKRGQTRQGQ